ncbi:MULTISPECIES: hypothetical protein [Lactiplantibacillus]|nr:hypothetical protein [Lactiplantibacillus plantarum]AGE38182.1 Hypothetical protein zj316_0643 [Lactiplantibacillus plantarum ZJ316]MCT6652448.1 hypothetical protein [Lactiplantibacillus plantarum]MDH5111578.1 hypothetical protein [Lactiplantibacillus plantarum]MDN3984358.1 hypothetical protein [Lactiplantibacillus plantarum]MDT7022857.1 hypothetical protein [Lactiplantibacillus plantarum]
MQVSWLFVRQQRAAYFDLRGWGTIVGTQPTQKVYAGSNFFQQI